jgi:hypothetical protein
MDHDNLNLPGTEIPDLARTVGGMRGDELWVCGDRDRSIMACLRKIYRPAATIEMRGEDLLRQSIEAAFRATRKAMRDSEAVKGLFRADYLPSLRRRDEAIRLYFKIGQSKAALARWRKQATGILSQTVYDQKMVPTFLDFVIHFDALLRSYAFLVEEPEGDAPKKPKTKRDRTAKPG